MLGSKQLLINIYSLYADKLLKVTLIRNCKLIFKLSLTK